MDEDKAEVMPNIDYIYSAVIADSEALEEAKMTLEIIKKTDPGVYDEMINDTLSLIRKALSSSILGVIEKTDAELRRLHEVNAELVGALKDLLGEVTKYLLPKPKQHYAKHTEITMDNVKAIVPANEYIEILNKVLDMNEKLVKQNSLIIQSITLPQLMIKAQGDNNAAD